MSLPRVSFVIGGVQKGGTTALARFMEAHPQIVLPHDKEAHVFDDPMFDDDWGVEELDRRYGLHFDPEASACLAGDATPIYLMHPRFVERIAAYNPEMKWIVILRHPLERALSHYHMELARGHERWPFWLALILERWRLRGHANDFSVSSSLRRHSYRMRSDYAQQLNVLYGKFPREQVLVLRNRELALEPETTMQRIWDFIGLETPPPLAFSRVFEGDYCRLLPQGVRWNLLLWWFRELMSRQAYEHAIHWDTDIATDRCGG